LTVHLLYNKPRLWLYSLQNITTVSTIAAFSAFILNGYSFSGSFSCDLGAVIYLHVTVTCPF